MCQSSVRTHHARWPARSRSGSRHQPDASEQSGCSRWYMGRSCVGQIAPWCSRSQDPEDAIEDTTVVRSSHAARLVRQHQLNGRPLVVGEFIAHDSSPQFGDLNHGSTAGLNGSSEVHRMSAFGGRSGRLIIISNVSTHDRCCRKNAVRLEVRL
jgi:hypothetical protein